MLFSIWQHYLKTFKYLPASKSLLLRSLATRFKAISLFSSFFSECPNYLKQLQYYSNVNIIWSDFVSFSMLALFETSSLLNCISIIWSHPAIFYVSVLFDVISCLVEGDHYLRHLIVSSSYLIRYLNTHSSNVWGQFVVIYESALLDLYYLENFMMLSMLTVLRLW